MTKIPNIDFETYSAAGFRFDETRDRWVASVGNGKAGLPGVGAPAYAEHESTEVVCMAYNMYDGAGIKLWTPGQEPPTTLLAHVVRGGLIRAANTRFEFLIWNHVCTRLYSWPPLHIEQMRDPLAHARAYSLPGSLAKVAQALRADVQKDEDGRRLIKKFSIPRTPTKNDRDLRKFAELDLVDGSKFYEYCINDVATEDAVSDMIPALSDYELETWLTDQRINDRGIAIDMEGLKACEAIIDVEMRKGNECIQALTGGAVSRVSEVAKIGTWLASRGIPLAQLDKDCVARALKRDDLPDDCRSVLLLRSQLGAASVKKVYAIRDRVSRDGRIRDLFMYCGADRTGRFAGRGPQPQNLPNSGPAMAGCACGFLTPLGGKYALGDECPHCKACALGPEEWGIEAAELFLHEATKHPTTLREHWPDPVAAVAGSLRCMFTAGDGMDLLCSDYSAIEAVVLAALAGEQWRLDVFHTHGKIYEMSASKITGIPFAEFENHKRTTGDHHPMRKKIGKVAELASGYQGGLGAWKAFGADKHLEEQEIRDAIKAWRNESPSIVRFWREIEGCALRAVRAPGSVHGYRGMIFRVVDDVLTIRLLSGRCLNYHEPRIFQKTLPWGSVADAMSFMGVDSFTKKWTRMDTYGGRLTENIVQATARDLLTFAMNNLEAAGYPIVMHVHDEIISEIPTGTGDVEEFERIMGTVPSWALGWPVRAAGGWRGKRYRKD